MTRRFIISAAAALLCLEAYSQAEADSTFLEEKQVLNDYSLLGINYDVAFSSASFNPNRIQQTVFNPVNFGISYTHYGKLFGYMPYFGVQIGLQYSKEGYQFKENAYGIKDYINYAYKAVIETVEVPVLAHLHFDFWKMKLMADLGPFAGYRLSIHRDYVDLPDSYKTYENSFHELENRFDYGIKGGAGIAFVFDPIEIHIMCLYKYSLSNLHQPDINNRTMERDEYSKYYYKWSYPTNLVISAGIHYQLSKRTGKTRKVLRMQARDEAVRLMKEAMEIQQHDEKDNSQDR